MTRSTCLGFLSLPQFTGAEGEELLALVEAWMAKHDRFRGPDVQNKRPTQGAIGIYYIRDTALGEDDQR